MIETLQRILALAEKGGQTEIAKLTRDLINTEPRTQSRRPISTEPEGLLREALAADTHTDQWARDHVAAGLSADWYAVADFVLSRPSLRAALATQSRGLDVEPERLANAWNNLIQSGAYAAGYSGVSMHVWRAVAAEYARLPAAATQAPETEGEPR